MRGSQTTSFHPLMIARMLMRTTLMQEITHCGCITSGLIIERMARYRCLAEQFCQLDTLRGTLRQRLHRPEMGTPPVARHIRIN